MFLPAGSAAQLVCGQLVCFISFGMYSKFAPFIKESDDRVSQICQGSLFFSLVSSIVLKMDRDSSSDVLGVLLVITMARRRPTHRATSPRASQAHTRPHASPPRANVSSAQHYICPSPPLASFPSPRPSCVAQAVPPIIAFAFESGLDFEGGLHLSAVMPPLRKLCGCTVGRCLRFLLKDEGSAQPAQQAPTLVVEADCPDEPTATGRV